MIRITESTSDHDNLESLSTLALLNGINSEDAKVAAAIQLIIPQIEAFVDACHLRMSKGGRLFYLGAGTSGRLGIVDASECPPTFGIDHGIVVGIIAGGDAAIRKAVGNRADILFGTHGQFTASGAIRLAKQLEPYDPMWFEEPIPPDAPEEMAKVAAHTSIPIATGERLTSKYEFAHLLRVGGASIIQLATGRCGGILEGKKIASIAETYHAQIAPHLYCGPIEGAANIQLSTCTPNFLILESIQDWGGFHAKILKKPIQFDNGYVIPSKEPGLGVELNEEVALAHPYTGTDLHLNERQTPADLS